MIEREIKLLFADHEAARQAVVTAGGRLVVSRRLIDDRLFDTSDGGLRRAGITLRVRRDGRRTLLTCKRPAPPGLVKIREEFETEVADAETVEAILAALGYRQTFRSEKFREEYAATEGTSVAVDDTPIGVFVEIEGSEAGIVATATALGRSVSDYVLDSYPALYHAWCHRHGRVAGDMRFSERATVGR
jgi:adenylate cyclase class 2